MLKPGGGAAGDVLLGKQILLSRHYSVCAQANTSRQIVALPSFRLRIVKQAQHRRARRSRQSGIF
jgi:hypothetical protein